MKKLISFCLALAMAASLAACSQSGSGSSSQTAEESISSAVEESSIAGEESSAAGEESSAAEASETPETVTITSLNGEGAETQLEVPYDPQRIAILDMASLDILDALGVGGRVVGTASTSLDYLQSYINEDIANLGTIKEADLEAVMSCEPDVIFIGGRLASSYDALQRNRSRGVPFHRYGTGRGGIREEERQHHCLSLWTGGGSGQPDGGL